jgi:hypothetical protein
MSHADTIRQFSKDLERLGDLEALMPTLLNQQPLGWIERVTAANVAANPND